MKKNLSKWLTGATMFGAAMVGVTAGAMAAPYSVRYTDTASGAFLPSGINLGEQVSVKLILDNGNTSVANQTWSAANVQCIMFTFNNAQDRYVAVDYSSSPFSSTTIGTFTTNGSGQLQAGTIDWTDESDPITNPQLTNISGVTRLSEWFLNGSNSVTYWNNENLRVGFTNVPNDNQVANWSNPVPSDGVCFRRTSPAPAVSSENALFLGAALLLAGLWSVRRRASDPSRS